ncbi:MAG: HD domain-containing protein [Armatimonadota bacterium]|nr:HD domain-containing protein [Armatimonadota bacterium]MDR7494772.1 HD domain-containing protein [Armatimonadota bacterium]MDR7499274.1 HD domain-containing protein [Armatimonadota bacterium]MDR7505098.1 HD domain-containing protein [Armatimonadota bacterium]MDR7547390.1 HD domain-containing protein [Armatimonadota bacterium]
MAREVGNAGGSGFFMEVLPKSLQLYIIGIIVAAASTLWVLLPSIPLDSTSELTLFLVLIAIASMFPIPDPRGGFITAAAILFYVMISLYGPGTGLIVAGPGYAVGAAISRRWIPWRTLSNGAQMGLSVAAAGVAFRLGGGSLSNPDFRSLLLPLAAAVLTFQLVNNLLVAIYFNRLRGMPLIPTWLSDVKELLVSNLLSIPTAALLAILYKTAGPAVLLAYLVYLPLQRRAHVLYLQQKRIYDQAINSLVLAIDANFPQGKGHSRRVASIAAAIARQMRLSDREVETIELAALLHDVGLIGIDMSNENDTLSDLSGRFKEHTLIGAELVRELPQRGVANIVKYHHEKLDGTGYPDGLKGSEIPLGARIVAVAEVFDSRLSDESLRESPQLAEVALKQIRSEAGKSFDPRVVDALASAVMSGAIDWMSLQRVDEDSDPLRRGAAQTQ